MNLILRGLKCLRDNGFRYTIKRIPIWFRRKLILQNYYDDLRNRVNKYQNQYPLEPRRTAARLIWWNFKQLFKRHIITNAQGIKLMSNPSDSQSAGFGEIELDKKKLNIAFLLCGGLGDFLIEINYIYKFSQKFSDGWISIDIVPKRSINTARFLLEGHIGSTINGIYTEEAYTKVMKEYDLVFELCRYPRVIHRRGARIAEVMPELLDYVFLCEKFRVENDRFLSISPRMDGQSAMVSIIQGKKRIQQIDIYNYFEIGRQFEFPLYVSDTDILSRTGLESRPFITVHRGCDERSTKDSVKLWPLEYYNVLLRRIKNKYPELVIVQLGISEDRCRKMRGVDIDLIGQTSLADIAVLLRSSVIHIDGEGGMVHLRQALHGGKSVVFFGPTSMKFYGYDENENVCGDGCAAWCEWVPFDWQGNCMRGFDRPPCMQSIIPESVMRHVDKIMFEMTGGDKNADIQD